ncbi:hypothetical protein KOR34_24000 [Posidoniimonas corsicana]|uniref:Uncharacterized protein n=1 Tax=Posidoniimonas corsicana TaxID=1938618 RepID=A0A5C5VHU8_9BACT|nr:hypothetical protein [Posidoniimonas corsicana]TWT37449.1 hypothetical protein KOR34_24000 [Posidoniimonas corsicana]
MPKKKSKGKRDGERVSKVSEYAVRIREVHDTVRELVQLFFYLILSGLSLGMVLVGAWRIRLHWLG